MANQYELTEVHQFILLASFLVHVLEGESLTPSFPLTNPQEHDCKLTQEIIELIDREADLLMRGVKEGNLTGLRKRISTLFLQYIKTPTFNPEAAHLLKVSFDIW